MEERIVDLFCELVRIESESGNEGRFIEHMKGLLERDLNARTEVDAFGNLIGCVPAKGGDRAAPILLAAHADTVKPGVGIEPIVEDGVIRSAGETILGADDKAGVAQIVEAVRSATAHPPLEIVITLGEEVGLQGSRHLDVDRLQSKRAYIIDSERFDEIIVGGPTHISFDIEIHGKAAHAGMEPEKGISAIRIAASAIARMPEGRIDHETTANVGTIQGGLIRNGVPEKVVIQAECRSLAHEKALRQAAVMKKAFEDAAREMKATVRIEERIEYEAARLPDSADVVRLAARAIKAAGLTPSTKVITGGTDALVLMNRGIEAVALGFGGEDAHSTDERISVAALKKGAEILRTLLELAAEAGGASG